MRIFRMLAAACMLASHGGLAQGTSSPALTISLPESLRENGSTLMGTVAVDPVPTTDLTISLASSDAGEAAVPAMVTIPAGAAGASFAITPIDDVDADGVQTITITASAVGFPDASGMFSVADDDVHHFTLTPVANSILRNAPQPLTVTACDVNGEPIVGYNQPIAFGAAAGNGASIPVTPASASGFASGTVTTDVSFGAYGDGVILAVSDGAGHHGSSNAFAVTFGAVERFAWNSIPTPQYVDRPIPVTVAAVDAAGNPVPTFVGPANLEANITLPGPTTGQSTATSTTVFNGGQHDSRTQVIYLPGEVGGAATLHGLAFKVWSVSSSIFNNFTIRLKHTALQRYDYAAFESEGWTEVYRGDVSANIAGWMAIPFAVPFAYDGSQNLMVDFSFDNTGAVDSPSIYGTSGTNRVVAGGASSTAGDPRAWNGTTTGNPNAGWLLPDIRFERSVEVPFPTVPALSGEFSNGIWSGDVTVPLQAKQLSLRAKAGAIVGSSSYFPVVAMPPAFGQVIFSEDFETGTLSPSVWKITGTNEFRTAVASDPVPHGGAFQLLMDAHAVQVFSRNEATMTVNLTGQRGLRLKFWAEGHGDEPHGPPPYPFIGGADFDGVAISADGLTWYEVQGLRELWNTDEPFTAFTVDLDAAIAAAGISYNSAFKIRFNQYDDFLYSIDGIAVDDITIVASEPVGGLVVTMPAEVGEGDGSIVGSVAVSETVPSDLVLHLASSAPGKIAVPAIVTIPGGQTGAVFSATVLDDSFADGPKDVTVTAKDEAGSVANGAMIRIADNDAGSVGIHLPASISEGAGMVTGTVSLSAPSFIPLTVTLASDQPSLASVPATLTFPIGTTSVSFPIAIADDGLIDGDVTVNLTARTGAWTAAIASVPIVDDEFRRLQVELPARMREGDAPRTASVALTGTNSYDVIAFLHTSAPAVATVPGVVVIPAGLTKVYFPVHIQDDLEADGHQSFTITASAASFADGATIGTVRDNEAHHFTFEPIGSPLVTNGPIPVEITACDAAGDPLMDYDARVLFSAASDSGAMTVTPTTANAFYQGVWKGGVYIDATATNVVVSVSDSQGHTGTSNAFDLVAGNVAEFAWDPIGTPKSIDTPIPVTVRAVDPAGATDANYHGRAHLYVAVSLPDSKIGTGTTTTSLPLTATVQDLRANILFTAAEMGGSRRLGGLAFFVTTGSSLGQSLDNLTIRLKHSSRTELGSSESWENGGWTTVYRASPTITSEGWLNFDFATWFDYNGSDNLIVCFTIDRAAAGATNPSLEASYTSSLVNSGSSNGANGDPLLWAGTTPNNGSSSVRPTVRFNSVREVPLRPTEANFVGGAWTGEVSVPLAGKQIRLVARSGSTSGSSEAFAVATSTAPATGDVTIFTEDFENAGFDPAFWTITGVGSYHTGNTTSSTPHGGTRHMVMDARPPSGGFARNEATLTLNLAGRSGVTLSYWVKGFNDVSHGPPIMPFPSTGADFDGVAISADGGVSWYEVQGLRSLDGSYVKKTVNLDPFMAGKGLSYGSNFKIRFNQYGSYTGFSQGIAIDDIRVAGNAVPAFVVEVPSSVTEGAGTLPGTVRLNAVSDVDTVVSLESQAPAKIAVPATVTIPAGQVSADFSFTVLNDEIVDGMKPIVILALVGTQVPWRAAITVIDDESIPFVLVAPSSFTEGSPQQTGTITLGAEASGTFTVYLWSSDSTELQVPPSVVLQAGERTASFPIYVSDDSVIDGAQSVTLTASVVGWGDETISVVVADSENRNLGLSLPSFANEGGTSSGSVSISGTLSYDLVVSLTSSNPSQYAVPATVTIEAGDKSVSYTATVVDDTAADGMQSVIITANATGFSAAARTIDVYDNDAHHFTFVGLPSTVVRGQPTSFTISARDVNDVPMTSFAGPVTLTAAGGNGAVPISPGITTAFTSGSWKGNLTFADFGSNVVLTATSASGISSSSTSFTVDSGEAASFVWEHIASPQNPSAPFPAAFSARDSVGNIATNYNGPVSLTSGAGARTVGDGSVVFSQLIAQSTAARSRAQCIYVANELEGAGRIVGLSFDVASVPSLPLTRFTVRVKPTTLSSYSPASWQTTGWTIVYQKDLTITSTGWVYLPFSTPIDYDGVGNLMVDFSFLNATNGSSGSVRATTASASRTYYASSIGSTTDPLNFSSGAGGSITTSVPNLRLRMEGTLPVTPSTVTVSNGTWSGMVSVGIPGSGLTLTASQSGVYGDSEPFESVHPASMVVIPAGSLSTTGLRGGPFAPASHSFTVRNTGSGTMAWGVGANQPWVTLAPSSGSLGSGESVVVLATLVAEMLTEFPSGTHVVAVSFSNETSGVGNVSQTVKVIAGSAGELSLTSGENMEAVGLVGGPFSPADQEYVIRNDGDAPLTWSATADASWLDVSPASGVLAVGMSTVVTAAIEGQELDPGTHLATVEFRDAANGRGTFQRTVSARATLPAPEMFAEPDTTPASSNTVSWKPVSGADSYEVQASVDPAFGNGVTSGWNSGTAYTFAGLSDGSRYYYRTRARRISQTQLPSWIQTSSEDFNYGLPANVTVTFDGDVVLETVGEVYFAAGTLTSSAIAPSGWQRWGRLSFAGDVSGASTTLKVDVLNEGGELLAADVPSGADLNAISLVASQPAIRLRARLGTNNGDHTPRLHEWAVEYLADDAISFVSEWSEAVASTQFNASPVIAMIANQVLVEDGATEVLHLNVSDDSTERADLLIAVTSSNSTLIPADGIELGSSGGVRTLRLKPAVDASGDAVITVRVTDQGAKSAEQTFGVVVKAVNDVPSFVKGADQNPAEDSGVVSVSGWATSISPGPSNEAGQAVSFIVEVENPALFSQTPTLAGDGTLAYSLAPNAHGYSTVTVRLRDSGGVEDGGIDESSAQSFLIIGHPVNDRPSFIKGSDQVVSEDSDVQSIAGWATAVVSGPANEGAQELAFEVRANDPSLFAIPPSVASNGTLVYAPAPNAHGETTVTISLRDNGGAGTGGMDASDAQSFTVRILPVNDAPGFIVGLNQNVRQNDGPQTVPGFVTGIVSGPANEAVQSLEFVVTTDNDAMFASLPLISPAGTLTFAPAPTVTGSALVSVRLRDSGGTARGGVDSSDVQSFVISSTFVNDAPMFVAGPSLEVAQDAGPQSIPAWATAIAAGPADEVGQLVDFQVVVDGSALFAVVPTITSAGMLSFTPAAGASGTATITVRLHDNGGTADGGVDVSASSTFTIAVTTFVEEVGTYNGLIVASEGTPEIAAQFGLIRVNVGALGPLSGTLTLDGRKLRFKGSVDLSGVAHFGVSRSPILEVPRRNAPPLLLSLRLDVANGTDKLHGRIDDGATEYATIEADRALFTATANALAPYRPMPLERLGVYTAVFSARDPELQGIAAALYPQGSGAGTVKVNKDGSVRFIARLADGTKISYGNVLSKDHVLPLYQETPTGCVISGEVKFRDVPAVSDFDSSGLRWFRPAKSGKFYPAGWPAGIRTDLLGSKYLRPSTGEIVLPGLSVAAGEGNARLTLSGGGVETAIHQSIRIASDRTAVLAPNPQKASVTFNRSNGLFKGQFKHPVGGASTLFEGAVLQKQTMGAGYFRTKSTSGSVLIDQAGE